MPEALLDLPFYGLYTLLKLCVHTGEHILIKQYLNAVIYHC